MHSPRLDRREASYRHFDGDVAVSKPQQSGNKRKPRAKFELRGGAACRVTFVKLALLAARCGLQRPRGMFRQVCLFLYMRVVTWCRCASLPVAVQRSPGRPTGATLVGSCTTCECISFACDVDFCDMDSYSTLSCRGDHLRYDLQECLVVCRSPAQSRSVEELDAGWFTYNL